jgi:hypothetical protein
VEAFMEIGSVKAAIERASAGYSTREWAELPPRIRTAAVYAELRLLDAEAISASRRSIPEREPNSPTGHAVSRRGLLSLMLLSPMPWKGRPSARDRVRSMGDASDDTVTTTAKRHARRLSDKILSAFHQACDQADFEVAERLLNTLDTMTTAQRRARAPRGSERRRNQGTVVAAQERLWQLRHSDTGAGPRTQVVPVAVSSRSVRRIVLREDEGGAQ